MNHRANPWVLGLLAGALLGGAEVRRFESLAAKDIKSKLSGNEAQVQVRTVPHGPLGHLAGDLDRVTISARNFTTEGLPLFTEPDRSRRGKARKVEIRLEDFRLAGLRISALDASIPNCRFDLPLAMRHGKIRLSESGTGTGSVTILASDLEEFILRKFHEIKHVSVHLNGGRVIVSGDGEFLIAHTAFKVSAALVSPDGAKLMLQDADVTMDGHPASEAAEATLLTAMNPVVDLNDDLHLWGAIKVESIALESDRLVASGPTHIPVRPSQ